MVIDATSLKAMHADNLKAAQANADFYKAYRDFIEEFGITKTQRMVNLESALKSSLDGWANIAGRMNEDKTCAIFDLMVLSEDSYIVDHLHADIVSMRKEVRLPCGNADRVLHHADGTLTVVEIKARGSRRDHACGLGQALVYAAALRGETGAVDVRAAIFVGGEKDAWIASACASTGVTYLHMPAVTERLIDDHAAIAASALA